MQRRPKISTVLRRSTSWVGVVLLTGALVACSSAKTRATPKGTPAAATRVSLVPTDGAAEEYFGGALWYDVYQTPVKPVYYATPGEAALDNTGTLALIGSPGRANGAALGTGAAYLFADDGKGWSQVAELRADDGAAHDGFGWGVALSGDGRTAVVGAPYHDAPQNGREGAVYVFEASPNGSRQSAMLRPNDGHSSDNFGWTVAISRDGNWILAGATGHRVENTPRGGGAAYVFHRDNDQWTQVAELAPRTPIPGEGFGSAVALSADGSTAVVTTRDQTVNKAHHIGTTHIFRTIDHWQTHDEVFTARNPNQNPDGSWDAYGVNASISDDGRVVAIAAPDVNVDPAQFGRNGYEAGATYLYTTSSEWTPSGTSTITLVPPAPSRYGFYGSSVALTAAGDRLAIGVDGAGSNSQGAAYVVTPKSFDRKSPWQSQQLAQELVPAPHAEQGRFGTAIALSEDGGTLLATSPLLPVSAKAHHGAAFIVRVPGWSD
jgi:hypothetical protein